MLEKSSIKLRFVFHGKKLILGDGINQTKILT